MGLVFDVKHYAIHDGPGIRTTVFLKGCPLDCPWCHNPESKGMEGELMWLPERCIGCNACVEACPSGAISLSDALVVDQGKCTSCWECAEACYADALRVVGMEMTVEEVMDEVIRDRVFHDESGGGVTFSGGEPLSQPGFLMGLLERCKTENIHTAVDTSGHADGGVVEKIKRLVDLWLYDLKHMDPDEHKRVIGVSNEVILENLERLKGLNVWIRMPLIPGFNDGAENIRATAEYMKLNGFNVINILPYHTAGSEKTPRLLSGGGTTKLYEPPTDEKLNEISRIFEEHGLNIKMGG